jgi:hypothetical protein
VVPACRNEDLGTPRANALNSARPNARQCGRSGRLIRPQARVSIEWRDTYRMGWWVREPILRPDETVQWQHHAVRHVGAFGIYGGRLFLTSARLIHEPARIAVRARPWKTPRANIRNVTVEPRQLTLPLWGMGLRKRLRIELVDGGVELFMVNGLKVVLTDLEAALATDAPPPGDAR